MSTGPEAASGSRGPGAAIAVTGWGFVTPLGNDDAAFATALFAGRSALVARLPDLPGIDVPAVAVAPAPFDESAVLSRSRVPLDRGAAMALAAAHDAATAAGLAHGGFDAERLGIFWGSGMAGAGAFETICRSVFGQRRRMRPTSVITTMPNAPAAELALLFGARGAALSYGCACASSAVAIGEAMRAIRAGWIDIAIVGGSESMLTPGILASWQAMRVLAPLGAARSDDERDLAAAGCCRPFAADRAGFALGEAAAAFVIESTGHAARRGAAVRALLSGYATNCDGMHMTQPDPAGQARAMRAALADAGQVAADIGYVNAHGTATLAGDAAEAESLAAVFGPRGVPVSSIKAIHGHLLGAGGAVELLATLLALEHRRLPPTGSVAAADPALAIDLVTGDGRDAPELRFALSNSFAFGGTNAVLVAGRA